MYIAYNTLRKTVDGKIQYEDNYSVVQDLEETEEAYELAVNRDDIFTCGTAVVIKSMDHHGTNLFVLTHTHKHGTSLYHFLLDQECSGHYNDENMGDMDDQLAKIIKELEVEYETGRHEFIDIERVSEIKTIL